MLAGYKHVPTRKGDRKHESVWYWQAKIWYQLSRLIRVKLPPLKHYEADVSSFSPLPEVLWVVCCSMSHTLHTTRFHWMGSKFHVWIDYNGLYFKKEKYVAHFWTSAERKVRIFEIKNCDDPKWKKKQQQLTSISFRPQMKSLGTWRSAMATSMKAPSQNITLLYHKSFAIIPSFSRHKSLANYSKNEFLREILGWS